MDDWMRLPVSQLKRLVKSRAGRVAELQMEIKILEGIMERKVRDGDLGGSLPGPARKSENAARREGAEEGPARESSKGETPREEKAEQTKITEKSSDHAFREID